MECGGKDSVTFQNSNGWNALQELEERIGKEVPFEEFELIFKEKVSGIGTIFAFHVTMRLTNLFG